MSISYKYLPQSDCSVEQAFFFVLKLYIVIALL